jgi:hypothetical protein
VKYKVVKTEFLFVLIPQMRRNTAEEVWYRVAGNCPYGEVSREVEE